MQLIQGPASPEKLHEDLVANPHAVVVCSELANFFNKQKYMEGMIPYMCLTPDQRILTAELEWIPVGSLHVGEELVGFDEFPEPGQGQHRCLRRSKVTHTGVKQLPCLRITTDQGTTTCSTEHPFLILRSNKQVWKKAEDLRSGDQIRYLGTPWETDFSNRAGWLAGILDGEGNVSKYHVGITQNPGIVLNNVKVLLDSKQFNFKDYKHADARTLRIPELHDRLRLLGQMRPIRLLKDSGKCWENLCLSGSKAGYATVKEVVPIGKYKVIALGTSTKTIISEGFFTHNTELLDNSPSGVERRTRSGGITRIPQPAVTVVGGSTPEWLQDQLPDSAGTGGFLARFLVCREDRKFRKLPLPSYTLGRQASDRLRHERSNAAAAFGGLVGQSGEVRFRDYEVADRFVELVNRRGNPKGFLAPFAAREVEFTLRLAMLSALARGSREISEPDVVLAGDIFGYCYNRLDSVVVPFTPKGKLLKIVLDLLGEKPLGETQIISAMKNFTTAQEVQVLLGSLLIGKDVEKLKNGKYRRVEDADRRAKGNSAA